MVTQSGKDQAEKAEEDGLEPRQVGECIHAHPQALCLVYVPAPAGSPPGRCHSLGPPKAKAGCLLGTCHQVQWTRMTLSGGLGLSEIPST